MTGSFRGDDLERKLRAGRPRPADELVQRIEGRVRSERVAPRHRFRLALPAVFTAVVLGGLAAVGGVSYAASGVVHAAKTVSHVFTPASAHHVAVASGLSSGGDQYTPATAWGAAAYTTDAAPTLSVGDASPGAFTPPLTPTVDGPTATVQTSFKLDSQAHLYISVVDTTTDKKVLITQTKSSANGKALKGVQAKTVNYLVLVPRTIPLKVAVPSNLLTNGSKYSIQIIAVAPNGKKTKVLIPFNAPVA